MDPIRAHYEHDSLLARIDAALEKYGHDPRRPSLDDLAPLDEFHVRGPVATDELIAELGVGPDAHVLDIGSGLGGPARRLAHATGCRVTGIDLSASFCDAGNELSRRVGLADRVRLLAGDATQPERVVAGTFDAAWSIHVGMNVADKAGLYGAAARVLAAGGPLLLYDILATGGGAVRYPTPWAPTADQSFLTTPAELRACLETAGFRVERVQDQTDAARVFLREWAERVAAMPEPPTTGRQLILGPRAAEMLANLRWNLENGRLAPTVIMARKA